MRLKNVSEKKSNKTIPINIDEYCLRESTNQIYGTMKQLISVEMLKITLEPIGSTIFHSCSLLKIILLANGGNSLGSGNDNGYPIVRQQVPNSTGLTISWSHLCESPIKSLWRWLLGEAKLPYYCLINKHEKYKILTENSSGHLPLRIRRLRPVHTNGWFPPAIYYGNFSVHRITKKWLHNFSVLGNLNK